MKRFLLGFLRGLVWPVRILVKLFRKRKKQSKLERKCYRHIRLNAPSNISWKRGFRKKGKKRKRSETPLPLKKISLSSKKE